MSKLLRVLIVEDSEDDLLLLLRDLRRGGYEVEFERVETAVAMQAALNQRDWDIVLSDYALPHFNAPAALAIVQERGLDLPFIIVSGTIGEDTAVASLKAGAHDFVVKANTARLIPAIERELREAETRRKRRDAEEALRQSERRFRALIENSTDAITLTDADGNILYGSPAVTGILAYMQQDWVGRNVFELIHPDDLSYAMSLLREVLSASYVTINGEVRLRHRNGAYRWVDATAKNMLNEPGTQAIVANFRDITERKRADDTLRQFTERLKTLHAIDQAILKMQSAESIAEFGVNTLRQQLAVFQVSITLFDFATRQETVLAASSQGNTAGARDVQFPLTPFSTKSIDILRKGQTQLIEDVSRLPHKPPPNHPLQAEGLRPFIRIPLIDQGKLIGSLNLGADIPNGFSPAQIEVAVEVADQMAIAIQQASLRAQLQQHADELEVRVTQRTQELQQTKDRIEAILNSSGDAIILTDADGLIQQVNPAFDRLLAYKDSEIVGKSIELLMAPPSLHVLQEAINAVVTERRLARLEVVGLRKDSTFFNGDLALAPIVEGNDTRSIVCSLRDITERKQMEDDLRRTLADERELNELKTRFVSMVSHDFRTPLTIIRSSADILQRYQAQLDEERKSKQFEKIYGQIERMTALLNDVIAVNQADAGKTPFHPVKLKLDPFCREIVEETQALPTISHTLVYTYTGDGSDVMVDEKLLHQAISNLLSNAIKYSPEGRSIYFDVLDEDDAAVMRIRDSGIGIPEADFAHLFESFHRAGNVGEVEGSGLGLAIVKRAIDAHSGSVTVESQVGVGTTFTITLPRH